MAGIAHGAGPESALASIGRSKRRTGRPRGFKTRCPADYGYFGRLIGAQYVTAAGSQVGVQNWTGADVPFISQASISGNFGTWDAGQGASLNRYRARLRERSDGDAGSARTMDRVRAGCGGSAQSDREPHESKDTPAQMPIFRRFSRVGPARLRALAYRRRQYQVWLNGNQCHHRPERRMDRLRPAGSVR